MREFGAAHERIPLEGNFLRSDYARDRYRPEYGYERGGGIAQDYGAVAVERGQNVGAAGGAGVGALAGGSLGESLLAGAAGAVAGRVIGKSEGTDSVCDAVLARNP